MSLLLDTHVWVWTQECPERIGPRARARLEDAGETLFVSTVSTLEIARLIHGGQLVLKGNLAAWVARSLELIHARGIELTHEMAIGAYALPAAFHKDPADRMLVATARACKLVLVTADERLLACRSVQTLDARV